jgi:hypothetical protein
MNLFCDGYSVSSFECVVIYVTIERQGDTMIRSHVYSSCFLASVSPSLSLSLSRSILRVPDCKEPIIEKKKKIHVSWENVWEHFS